MPAADSLIAELKAKYARPASIAHHAKEGSPPGSWLGAVKVALPDEPWPEFEGAPLQGVAQFNLLELPYRPPLLEDLAMITVFLRFDAWRLSLPWDPEAHTGYLAPGAGWLLRAYPTLDGLAPAVPSTPSPLRPTALGWSLCEKDFPSQEDADWRDREKLDEEDDWYELFPTAEGLKIGGWPYLIQGELEWTCSKRWKHPPAFGFQIDSNPDVNLHIIDNGFCYFARGERGTPDEWAFEVQCL